jgi:serine protease Do
MLSHVALDLLPAAIPSPFLRPQERASLRRRYHIPKEVEGVVVTNVASDSSAATAGIEPGAVIVQIDQKPVKTPQQAAEELRQAAANGNILLLLNRQGKSQFVGLSVGGAG